MSAKTPVTVLQELMTKIGELPQYECTSQTGPQHLANFEYHCKVMGLTVSAIARSKKEAKQEAARVMLVRLKQQLGVSVPLPYGEPERAPSPPPHTAQLPARSFVALLKELCEEYRLPAVEYELVGDTGPPHLRHFTIRAAIGPHQTTATATTKKAARQDAAEKLYIYLRTNLPATKDFVEEEALARAHDKAMERYVEVKQQQVWRPDLSQRVADYHLGILMNTEEHKIEAGRAALAATERLEPEDALVHAIGALGMSVAYEQLGGVWVASLAPASPAVALAGTTRAAAAAAALRYLHSCTRTSSPA